MTKLFTTYPIEDEGIDIGAVDRIIIRPDRVVMNVGKHTYTFKDNKLFKDGINIC